MNFYFEIAPTAFDRDGFDHQYYVQHDVGSWETQAPPNVFYSYNHLRMSCSNRVWQEDDTGQVTWKKNRFMDTNLPVDLKEFMWIKLKCQNI